MLKPAAKKIAYLFGAGATHAELHNIEPDLVREKTGLLIKDVSSRVIEMARRDADYLKGVEMVSGIKGDQNLGRIREVLSIMDKDFGEEAVAISSRAVAVSAYLFAESLFLAKRKGAIKKFAKFYVALIDAIKENLSLLSNFLPPKNQTILEDFQKYISQASVEPYSVKRRHTFLDMAFKYYIDAKTKGRIIGS